MLTRLGTLTYLTCALVLGFVLCVSLPMPSYASEGGGHGEAAPKEAPVEKEDGDPLEAITGGRFAGDTVYVHLPQILLPIIDDDGYQQIIHMLVDVGVKDFDTATKVQDAFPRVQDALLTALYNGFSNGSLRAGRGIDIEKTKESISITLKKLFGEDSVDEILIQGLSQRPYF